MASNSELLDRMLAEQPAFHRSETEISRSFESSESFLNPSAARRLSSGEPQCYGVSAGCARYLFERIKPAMTTLETGAGISTLIFAMRGARHTCVTPDQDEVALIQSYAAKTGIDTSQVNFVTQPSQTFLPGYGATDLDLVFLDGKHAFPWPIIDWFYTADKLRQGGLLILDDIQMRSVRILCEFLEADAHWRIETNAGGRTMVYRKVKGQVHDVAWHMQAWTGREAAPSLWAALRERLRLVVPGPVRAIIRSLR